MQRAGWRANRLRCGVAAIVAVCGFTACADDGGQDTAHDHAAAGADASAMSAMAGTAGVATQVAPTTREYFVGADEVEWNYAPDGRNLITGEPFDDEQDVFVAPGPDRIGSTYRKCLYRGYTDGTFTTLAAPSDQDGPLGILGPVIRAQVGDTIRVHYRNGCSFPTSMHPHGLFYDKSSEGALYEDGTSGAAKQDDGVPPDGTYTYTWEVPERAGPGPGDGSSVMWMYMSHNDDVLDTYSGLMGPIVVTRRGMANEDGSPADVDQELFALFAVMDENQTHYIDDEVGHLERPEGPDEHAEEFAESNLMHSINGYVYGNGPMFTVKQGERVRWYVMGMGTEVDIHTPHWHGNTAVAMGMRTDVVSVFPGTMVTADMTPDDPGIWLFHCHVTDHVLAGMQARYEVVA